jgi:PAS domain S-box-containing protein
MSKRILVIDDDLAIRKSFALALEGADCQVDTAESGKEGIDKASNTKYDLIFLDLKMPGLNGVETLVRLRDGGQRMPIYIVTAFHKEFMNQLRVAADKGYEFEVMKKPFMSEDLVRITETILEGARAMTMYEFKLYVIGRMPKSIDVIEELVKLLEDTLGGYYHLDVIDIIESPELAEKGNIVATPTLVKVAPEPQKRVVGDLSDKDKVLSALGLIAEKGMEKTRYKILLIEDDKLDQKAFMRMVADEELPYDCTVAGSVSEAKSILGSEKFDIVIADYMLGDGTAFDVLDLVKDAPIIFVTGAGDEEVATKAWKDGAYDYFIKDPERNYLKTVPIIVENAIRHKRMESKLRLLSYAIMSTDDSVYITDLEDKITFVNRAFCETYGYTEEEIIGKDCNILWKGRMPTADAENVYQAVSGWEVGFFHKRKDGSKFPVSLTTSDVKDDSGNEVAFVVISRNISEHMQIENELRTENMQLKKQNRFKSELFSATSNALGTLLGTLKNTICEAETAALGEISPEFKENLESVDENIGRLTRVISDFNEISEIDRGKMKVEAS